MAFRSTPALSLAAVSLLWTGHALAADAKVTRLGNIEFSTSQSSVARNQDVSTLYLGTSGINGFVSNRTVTSQSVATGTTTLSFSGTSGIYSGSVPGLTAAPWTPTGKQTSNYLAAQPTGNVTISYSTSQKYFGLLWGSVDSWNTLKFYDGNKLVGQVGGGNVVGNANGDRGANGSFYVNMNFLGTSSFNRVVVSTGHPAFEFNLVSASKQQQDIRTAPLGLPGATQAGMLMLAAGAGLRRTRARRRGGA